MPRFLTGSRHVAAHLSRLETRAGGYAACSRYATVCFVSLRPSSSSIASSRWCVGKR